jgi:hypothetical protein
MMPSIVLLTRRAFGRALSALALLNCPPRILSVMAFMSAAVTFLQEKFGATYMHQLLMVLLTAKNSEEELDDEKLEGLGENYNGVH